MADLSTDVVDPQRYFDLFAQHRSASITALRSWQAEALERYAKLAVADAALEAPTGTGKTLPALLIGEEFRQRAGGPVAYLAGTKQLARQVERQANEVGIAVVRFQDSKHDWSAEDVTKYEWGEAIAVANYWNYFNERPGLVPAGMLILDDVHLLESVLRNFFAVEIHRTSPLYREVLERVVTEFPYYSLAADLYGGTAPPGPPEMLAFVDSAKLAPELRSIIDVRLEAYSQQWWPWQRIRSQAEVCCWLVSQRAITITPFIPPTQEIEHFSRPQRRLYLSATVGTVDDVQRRLGCPPFEKLVADTAPRQGERFVVLRDKADEALPAEMVIELRPFLERQRKALWLCTRTETADAISEMLILAAMPGPVLRLHEDNGADELFAAANDGYLVTAGRFDGMDFPGDACRLEIVPEVPVATSDLEEFISSYLRDAAFAGARFAQRVAQALGRCNRDADDRAVYLLTDPEFLGRLRRRDVLAALPLDVRIDVAGAVRRAGGRFAANLADAELFLGGHEFAAATPPSLPVAAGDAGTGRAEVDAILALWRHDYQRAADILETRVITKLPPGSREYKAFWISLRALSLIRQAEANGDTAAAVRARQVLDAAVRVGATSTFFARLRAALARVEGTSTAVPGAEYDALFAAWDKLIDRYSTTGPAFESWADTLMSELEGDDHDAVARAVASVGREVLGLAAEARKPTRGEEDAVWWLPGARRALTFEVKLAPQAKKIVNEDVEQAEGAARALEAGPPNLSVRGLLLTPHRSVDEAAEARLDRLRLVERDTFVAEVRELLRLLRHYRSGWSDDAGQRTASRRGVEAELPRVDWLWEATLRAEAWIEPRFLHDRGDQPRPV